MKKRTLIFAIIKVCVDAAIAVLFLLLMGYHLLDGATHEWLGVSLFILFLAHNGLNYKWYLSLFKGKYGAVRIVQTVINVLLWAAMICCIVSSMCISAYAFTWTHTNMMMGRKLHLGATVWAFVLMSLHLGFHWSYFIGMAKKIAKPSEKVSAILKWVFRAAVLAGCLYAATVFMSRGYFADMSFTVEFKFISEVDYNKSVAQYFFESLSIMALITTVGYYLKKAITDITATFRKAKVNSIAEEQQ